MAKTRRREFRYDPDTPEGKAIDRWLEKRGNVNQAMFEAILSAALKPDNLEKMRRIVREAVREAFREELAHLKLAPAPDNDGEDPVLAKTIDELFD